MKKIIPLILLCFIIGGTLNFLVNKFNSGNSEKYSPNISLEENKNINMEDEVESEDEIKAQIVEKYQEKYDDFKENVQHDLDDVFNEAKGEYYNMSSDEQKINLYTLAYKYMNKVTELEAQYDETVAGIVEDMKEELANQGLSTASADDIQKRYDNEKKSLKEDLVAKTQELTK